MQPTADDIVRLRSPKHKTDPILNIVPKVVVATAQVNQASFVYPISSIIVDNTSADWLTKIKIGQMFTIGTAPGLDDIMYGVVRAVPNSTTLYIDAKGLGDPGYPSSIIQPIQNNYYVTVYKFRPPWGLLSSIRAGIFYKKWDITYSDQLLRPDPICRFGGWRQAFVDEATGTAFLDFDCSDSHVWGTNNSAIDPIWNVDGGTIIVGTVNTPQITVEFEPGFYEVECTFRDAVGKSHTGYRYVWINTSTPNGVDSPFSYNHVVRITTDSQEVNGRKMTFEIDGNLTDEIFPGQGYFFKEMPKFLVNGNWESLDNEDDYPFSYVGYRVDSSYKTSKNLMTTTITTAGPGVYANDVVSSTQQIVETQYPSTWAECSPLLSNPVGAAWYSVYWHAPYLINAHDFTFDEDLIPFYRRRSFQFNSTNVGPQLSGIAEMFLGFIGWKSNGTLKMVKNPMYFTNSQRNALDVWWTWLPEDIQGSLEISRTFKMPTGQVYGSAFSFDGTDPKAYASLAPGYSKAQGPNTTNMTAFIVWSPLGQDEVNRLTGMQFGIENRKEPDFSLTAMKNLDIIEPVNIDSWCFLNADESYDPEGYGWVNKRIMPTRVTRTWAVSPQPTKSIQVEFQVESFGQPGVTVPIDRGGGNNWWTNQWNPSINDPYEIKMPDLGYEIDILYAWNDEGVLARTQSFTEEQVDWDKVVGYEGAMRDAAIDYNSSYFTDPDNGYLFGWFVSDEIVDGVGTIHVYYADLFSDTPSFTEEDTFTTGPGYTGKVRVATSGVTGTELAVVAWKDQTGVSFSRTTSTPFHSWTSPVHVGAVVSDTDHDDEELGLGVKGQIQAIIAPDGSVNPGDGKYDYFLYEATTATGSFNLVSNQPVGERAVLGCVQISSDPRVIVGYEGPGTTPPIDPLEIVTFDVDGYQHYDTGIYSVGPVGPWPPAVFQGVNGLRFGTVACEIDCLGEYTFESMTWYSGIDGDIDSGSPGAFTYRTALTFKAGTRTDQETVVCRKVFSSESVFYDETKWKNSVTAAELGISVPFDSVTIGLTLSGSGGSPGIWYLLIDNIDIKATFLQRESTRLTRQVIPITDDWSDISPAIPSAPVTPYGVSMSPTSADYSMLATDEDNFNRLFYSSLAGIGWGNLGKSRNIGVKRNDIISVFFGYNSITVSKDNGVTQYPRIGDWSVKVGQVGTIRGLIGIF